MLSIVFALATYRRWLVGAIHTKRHLNHHHRREAKEQ